MILLSLVMALLLVGLIAFAVVLFLPEAPPRATPGAEPTQVVLPPGEALIASGDVAVVPSVPTTLTIGAVEYPVLPVRVAEDGSLDLPSQDETAFWVYGTVVNYAIGFEATPENTIALSSVREGDEVQLTLGSGEQVRFRVSDVSRHSRSEASVFDQTRPGLTLFLAGGVMIERLVVRAEMLVEDGEPAAAVGIATSQLTDSLQVTLSAVESVLRPDDLPVGWTYLLVDYQVTNTSAEPLALGQAHYTLTDSAGQEYAPALQGSRYANFGTLPSSLSAGETAQSTAVFLVPASLGGPSLLWRFFPDPADAEGLAFSFPYQALASDLTVELTSAMASPDGVNLEVNGLIFNPSPVSAVIAPANVRLLTSTGEAVTLRFADPPLPWHVGGQQTMYFTLTYVMPASPSATFSVLDFQFKVMLQ